MAVGGTAVGTGLNAPDSWRSEIVAELSQIVGVELRPATNSFEQLAAKDGLVSFSGALNTLAVALNKIANDLRLLASGPRSGLAELSLPANEPGSSIMPGKVNPTQVEMLAMVAAQVVGNHLASTLGGMQGQLELNTFMPLIGSNIIHSIELLAVGMKSFADHCIDGIAPNEKTIEEYVQRSLMLVTALVPAIGYDKAARIAKHALANNQTLKESGVTLGLISAEAFDRAVRPSAMV